MSRRVQRAAHHRWCRRCGWKRTYDTAGKADYAKRRHSCARWLAKASATQRGAARMAAVDRTPKPCLHKVAQHQHGTYACYTLDACRCLPCAAAVTAYENNRRRQNAYGRGDLVDADPVRAHVNALRAQGMGFKRIAQAAGVSNATMTKLLYGHYAPGPGGRDGRGELLRGPSKRVTKATARKVLAVGLDLADGRVVPADGSIRRVRALVAIGWSQARIASHLGIGRQNFHLGTGRRAQVTKVTADAVAALYDELSMRLPPETNQRERIAASRSRRYAKARGWLPPLALDDERLDDPTYLPGSIEPDAAVDAPELDLVAVERRLSGDRDVRLTRAEQQELVRLAVERGIPKAEIERRTGLNPNRTLRSDAA